MKLECVIGFKIFFTAVFWAGPALLARRRLFARLGFPEPYPEIFVRLLGAAYLSLLLGYVLGLQMLHQGGYPAQTVWVGIVSNGGACIVLGVHHRTWREWRLPAQILMWVSLAATFLITAGLIWYGPVTH